MKEQIRKRRQDEFERQKKARDIVNENRHRIAIQSELVSRGAMIDPEYRKQLHQMILYRNSNVTEEMLNFHAMHEMVESPED